jgi:hypothetical protein
MTPALAEQHQVETIINAQRQQQQQNLLWAAAAVGQE